MRVRSGILFKEVDEEPPTGERIMFITEETPNTQNWTSCFRLGYFEDGIYVETVMGEGDYQHDDPAEVIDVYNADTVLCWAHLPKITEKSFK